MAWRTTAIRPGVLLLALAIAFFLWGVANGSSSVEQAFDVPVELHSIPDTLVVTDQNVDSVNVRVRGSRVALKNISLNKLNYPIDVTGGKPGIADYEVDVHRIELPKGVTPVSRSPSRVQVRFEERGRKVVSVRADLEGELPQGYRLVDVNVVPRRVWLAGARSNVLRFDDVATDPIDLTGLEESVEREVRLRLGGGTVWLEEDKPVKVLLQVQREPEPEPEAAPQLGGLEGEVENAEEARESESG
jgi:YbbR domain-containing protein